MRSGFIYRVCEGGPLKYKYLHCFVLLLLLSGCATSGLQREAAKKQDTPCLTIYMKRNPEKLFAIACGETIVLSHTAEVNNPALLAYLESLSPKTRLDGKKVKAVVTAYYGPLKS
jgi:hypothetical protein